MSNALLKNEIIVEKNNIEDFEQLEIVPPESTSKHSFDRRILDEYPFAQRKIHVQISEYSILKAESLTRGHTIRICPQSMEILTTKDYSPGALIKINVKIPDYWSRKQQFVEYTRIDRPKDFSVLGKVIECSKDNNINRKKNLIVQVVNIDETDEMVLKDYLIND